MAGPGTPEGPAAEAGDRPGAGDLLRIRLDLGYDGTAFSGWAAQAGRRTVEGALVAGLARVLRRPVETLTLVVAGRTDAGVHATGQVCHVDVPVAAWRAVPGRGGGDPATSLLRRLAGVLPDDVRVQAAAIAPEGFDARFSALHRRYAYLVCDHTAGVPPLRRRDVLRYPRPPARPLDVAAMDDAARRMVGLHDFAAYCRRRRNATTVRTLLEYGWSRDGDGFAAARVVADAFCHSMVRSLVGAVLAVGEGRRDVEWPARVLAGRGRDPAVNVVPPYGLTLHEIAYPPDAELAVRAQQARAVRALPGG